LLIMDFIKKHYEKMILALALLALIGSAGYLSFMVESLSQENAKVVRRLKPKGTAVPSITNSVAGYSNAIAAIQHPPLWNGDPARLFPEAEWWRPPTTDGTSQDQGPGPFLNRVTREPFSLLFMAYTGEGSNFQLNFLSWARTFYVSDVGMEVADRYYKTGYFIKKFTRKKITASDATAKGREKDVSELTLQREGEDPIVLVLNEIKEGREPVAWVACKGAGARPVRRQQSLSCGDISYKVVDIAPKQMIIMVEKTGERKTIPLIGAK
jgi:hypothetical protein